MVTEYLDYLWELGELPVYIIGGLAVYVSQTYDGLSHSTLYGQVYILVVLALHGSQVAMVWLLPVPGDLHTLAATSKMWLLLFLLLVVVVVVLLLLLLGSTTLGA